MVAGQHGQAPALRNFGQARLQPFDLRRAYAALVIACRMVGVQQNQAHMLGVDKGIGMALAQLRLAEAAGAMLHMGRHPFAQIHRAAQARGLNGPARSGGKKFRLLHISQLRIGRMQAGRSGQGLVRADGNRLDGDIRQGRALAHHIVVAGHAGPGKTQAGGMQFGAGARHIVRHHRIALRLPAVGHLRLRAPERPGTLAQFMAGLVHAAIGRQRRAPAAQNADESLQFIGLGVVDVVAGTQGDVVGPATPGRQRIAVQALHMLCQRPMGQGLMRPVHVQQRFPIRVGGQQLDPFAARRRCGVDHMGIAEVQQAEQYLARAGGDRATQIGA